MTELSWDAIGERYFETGVDRGVLYVGANPGVAWNGIVSVAESPSGGELKRLHYDGINYRNIIGVETFEATLSAFYSPREFDPCDGSAAFAQGFFATQQRRQSFGLAYRTKLGNDLDGQDHGYKIHLVYNALSTAPDRTYSTIDDSPNASLLSWKIIASPVVTDFAGPSAHWIINTMYSNPDAVLALEQILYGTSTTAPRLPQPGEVKTLFGSIVPFTITDLGDGSYTADGSATAVQMIDADVFQLTAATVGMADTSAFNASSS